MKIDFCKTENISDNDVKMVRGRKKKENQERIKSFLKLYKMENKKKNDRCLILSVRFIVNDWQVFQMKKRLEKILNPNKKKNCFASTKSANAVIEFFKDWIKDISTWWYYFDEF